MRKKLHNIYSVFFVIFLLFLLTKSSLEGKGGVVLDDDSGLMLDIPEPPEAGNELPSPIPVIYQFTESLMGGEFDKCLSLFHTETLLAIGFPGQIKSLMEPDYKELISYHTQVIRNEIRFLSKVLNRYAKGSELKYSNPRFQNSQCKVVVKLVTVRGSYELSIYSRFVDNKWQVYDYVLNSKRFSEVFRKNVGGMKVEEYIALIKPFFAPLKLKEFENPEFGIAMKLPETFSIKEKVSPALLLSASGFDNQFLLHVQAAVYDKAKPLKEVAVEIKKTIMPFKPKLYDQWKTELAGVEIGHVLFQFTKNQKVLHTHMVIIPLKEKLIVLNFYHNSLPLLKNMTNIREAILESLRLPKIEATAGEISIPSEDLSLPTQTGTQQSPTVTVSPLGPTPTPPENGPPTNMASNYGAPPPDNQNPPQPTYSYDGPPSTDGAPPPDSGAPPDSGPPPDYSAPPPPANDNQPPPPPPPGEDVPPQESPTPEYNSNPPPPPSDQGVIGGPSPSNQGNGGPPPPDQGGDGSPPMPAGQQNGDDIPPSPPDGGAPVPPDGPQPPPGSNNNNGGENIPPPPDQSGGEVNF
ncbi:MAG: hypothetical protein HQM08_29675 [Candidatus Riflebacteria bacterium]|nr:hypothetical protein [Candidatus Riflebacteria bacterium]